jgi:hypothetical protein
MIIFTPHPYEIIHMLNTNNIKLYNLTGYFEGIYTLNNLMPSLSNIGFDNMESYDYSTLYANYVLSNIDSFGELMLIMDPVFNQGSIVVIAINNRDEYRAMMNENLSNLIERRYGYPCFYIDDPQDLLFIDQSKCTFSSYGIMNLDNDIHRLEMQIPISKKDMEFVMDST